MTIFCSNIHSLQDIISAISTGSHIVLALLSACASAPASATCAATFAAIGSAPVAPGEL
jgi:hypothetical protein